MSKQKNTSQTSYLHGRAKEEKNAFHDLSVRTVAGERYALVDHVVIYDTPDGGEETLTLCEDTVMTLREARLYYANVAKRLSERHRNVMDYMPTLDFIKIRSLGREAMAS